MYKLDFEEAEEQIIKLPIFLDHGESKGIPEKTASVLLPWEAHEQYEKAKW